MEHVYFNWRQFWWHFDLSQNKATKTRLVTAVEDCGLTALNKSKWNLLSIKYNQNMLGLKPVNCICNPYFLCLGENIRAVRWVKWSGLTLSLTAQFSWATICSISYLQTLLFQILASQNLKEGLDIHADINHILWQPVLVRMWARNDGNKAGPNFRHRWGTTGSDQGKNKNEFRRSNQNKQRHVQNPYPDPTSYRLNTENIHCCRLKYTRKSRLDRWRL